jgi:hypothetical protein
VPRRFSRRREAALAAGVYGAYMLVRRAVVTDSGWRRARGNARRVAGLERRLGIDVEAALQRVLLPRRRTLVVVNVAYVTLNSLLTAGWPVLLYTRRDPEFHRLRRAVALSILGASPVFLAFPCDPPRRGEGFTDTIRDVTGIDLDLGPLARFHNPVAAMPSIHMAFAIVTATGIAQTARSPALRRLAPLYPPAVAFTVFATANHYVLDAVAGTALGAAALRLSRALE